jgi:hypothetical protein
LYGGYTYFYWVNGKQGIEDWIFYKNRLFVKVREIMDIEAGLTDIR